MRLTNPYDPWAHIGTVWPHIHVETARTLPDGVAGLIGDGVIWLCRSLSQRGRRSVLAHEIVHLERGPGSVCEGREEAIVDRIAARRLINEHDFFEALRWTGGVPNDEAADMLWVYLHTLAVRAKDLAGKSFWRFD